MDSDPIYVVWYASAGCLPDSGEPEFWGTLEECRIWVTDHEAEYARPWVTHDLYNLWIEEVI